MKRLLVGIDGSPQAAAALRWAASVAEPMGADVLALAAWTPGQAELPVSEARDEHADLRDALAAAREGLSGSVAIRDEIVDGAPVDVLLERSEGEDAGLVVVGLRGAGGFLGLRLGSVTDTLAHRVTRPLAVVPDGSHAGVGHIVLGVDGSHGATAAASWCAVFASALGAEVTAVAVYPHEYGIVTEQDPKSMFQYFKRALNEEWVTPLRDAGVTVHPDLVHEPHVAEALVDTAQRVGADAIVVGTHGFAPLIHRRLGGVAMRSLHTTPLPLVLVPPE